jgi:hypothetical protein
MNANFHESYAGGEIKPPSERSTGLLFAVVAVIIAVLWRDSPAMLWGGSLHRPAVGSDKLARARSAQADKHSLVSSWASFASRSKHSCDVRLIRGGLPARRRYHASLAGSAPIEAARAGSINLLGHARGK